MPQKRKELGISGKHLWYLVGLITADGCLSSDGRHIDITSKDKDFLEELKVRLGLVNAIGIKNKDCSNKAYHIQISNKNLYEFLLSIGLMPNKSLRLGTLDINKEAFSDFLRGLIDGDGCWRTWKYSTHSYEQWSLRIFSGSEVFLKWLKLKIEEYVGCRGKIYGCMRRKQKNPIYTLKYGKMSAKEIAQACYSQDTIALSRKAALARKCLISHSGWGNSITVVH
jgi:hypothetical protein